MIKYSPDGLVKFDSDKHMYLFEDKILTGVTTLISRYKNKFDAEKVATEFVRKNGGDVKELIDKWNKEGEISRVAGTAIHDIFETWFKTKIILNPGIHLKESSAIKFITDYFITGKLTMVSCEEIIYDASAGIASMIDCVVKNTRGQYFILDWKTNKKIEINGYGKKMFSPFNYLPDASFYHYSLQLSIYKKLYKENPITGIFIIHINDNGYEIIKSDEITTGLDTLLGMGRLDQRHVE